MNEKMWSKCQGSSFVLCLLSHSDRSKSKGSHCVCFVLLHSLLETTETNLKGSLCFLRISHSL